MLTGELNHKKNKRDLFAGCKRKERVVAKENIGKEKREFSGR